MKKYIFSLAVLLISLNTFAQAVLIEETEPERVYQKTKWGINRQHFGYWFLDMGFFIPTQAKYDIAIGKSTQWDFGYAYKIKTLKFMDLGLEASLSNNYLHLNKTARASFDTTRNWKKIKAFQNGIRGNIFLRFYLSPKRGNFMGTYLDLGFFANYHTSSSWVKKFKDKSIKIKQREYAKSDFMPLSYGPSIAFGRNQLSAFARYNLNSVLDDKVNLNPMPQLVFGFKFNLYKQ